MQSACSKTTFYANTIFSQFQVIKNDENLKICTPSISNCIKTRYVHSLNKPY